MFSEFAFKSYCINLGEFEPMVCRNIQLQHILFLFIFFGYSKLTDIVPFILFHFILFLLIVGILVYRFLRYYYQVTK